MLKKLLDLFRKPKPAGQTLADPDWGDEARDDLKSTIRVIATGEIRLGKNQHAEILDLLREVYINEDAPEGEQDAFVQYAREQIEAAAVRHAEDKAAWAGETDCDRLDHAEAALRDAGVLLWQVSPCCDTCSGAELPDRIDEIEARYPGFRERLDGYAFFIEQNMADMLSDGTQISVYLAYGWFPPEDARPDQSLYEENALRIGGMVKDQLERLGLEVDWNGSLSKKIGVTVNWQRREPLT